MRESPHKITTSSALRRLVGRAIRRARLAGVVATTIIVGLIVLPTAGARAAMQEAGHCNPDPWISVEYIGVHGYNPIGATTGKRAARSGSLTLAVRITKKRKTTWVVGGSATVSWGIAQVEAHTSYSVTKVTKTG
jgi:hypothetical protein